MLARATTCSLVAGLLTLLSSSASAQRVARVDGVRIVGSAVHTSTGSPSRWPEFELRNHSANSRTVRVISLVSVDGSSRRSHRVISPTTIELRPSQTRTIELRYAGTPYNDGVGAFTVYRFRITVEVDGQRATFESTSEYVCRIPVHR